MDSIFLLLFLVSFISLVVGLVKPTVFSRVIKGEITRKRIAKIFGIALGISFIFFGVAADRSKNNNGATEQRVIENTKVITNNKNDKLAPVVEKTKTAPTPAPAPIPTPISSETVSQQNAVKKAKSYLVFTAFSHDGLVAQLEFEQFPHADAVYGADNSGADWNEQAAKKAKSYMGFSAFSRGGLITQLEFDKFTRVQAEYGASAVGL